MDCIYIALFPKALYNIAYHSPIHAHIHIQPCKATASSSGAVKLRCLAQGHLDTQEEPGIELAPLRFPVNPL